MASNGFDDFRFGQLRVIHDVKFQGAGGKGFCDDRTKA